MRDPQSTVISLRYCDVVALLALAAVVGIALKVQHSPAALVALAVVLLGFAGYAVYGCRGGCPPSSTNTNTTNPNSATSNTSQPAKAAFAARAYDTHLNTHLNTNRDTTSHGPRTLHRTLIPPLLAPRLVQDPLANVYTGMNRSGAKEFYTKWAKLHEQQQQLLVEPAEDADPPKVTPYCATGGGEATADLFPPGVLTFGRPTTMRFGVPLNWPLAEPASLPAAHRLNDAFVHLLQGPGSAAVYTGAVVHPTASANIGQVAMPQWGRVDKYRLQSGLEVYMEDPYASSTTSAASHALVPQTGNNTHDTHECLAQTSGGPAQVYDGRLSGYGDPRRGYFDAGSQQYKFMYDDVDHCRGIEPWLQRHSADHLDYGQTGDSIQADVHAQYIQQTNAWREELTEARMRKIHANAWQQREMPLRKTRTTGEAGFFRSGGAVPGR